MSGPTTLGLRLNDPLAIDSIARAFPALRIDCCHPFWPDVEGMLAVAFRHENVFVSPDMYIFAPGGDRYIGGANGFMSRQMLFGTSCPFRPLAQTVPEFLALGLTSEVRLRVMWVTPARLLGLG